MGGTEGQRTGEDYAGGSEPVPSEVLCVIKTFNQALGRRPENQGHFPYSPHEVALVTKNDWPASLASIHAQGTRRKVPTHASADALSNTFLMHHQSGIATRLQRI